MMPRIGALEITVCYTTSVESSANGDSYTRYLLDSKDQATGGLLLYSKLMVSMWPHFSGVAERIRRFITALDEFNESQVSE